MSGHSTGMKLKVISDNIDRLLLAKGISADKASRQAGHPDAIRNIRRKLTGEIKGSGVSAQIVHSLARVFGVTATELMEPHEKVHVPPVPGLRGQLLFQLEFLDKERVRVMEQLRALEEAETTAARPRKRNIR